MTRHKRDWHRLPREASRAAFLSVAGLLPFKRRAFEVRFLYGHSLQAAHVSRFRRTLRFLRQHYEFITNTVAVDLLRQDQPPLGRYLALSFDDGFKDNYDFIAPLLLEMGATACFFVTSNFIDCTEDYRRTIVRQRLQCPDDRMPMTWDMVRELCSAGFEVGAHTADHYDLASLPAHESAEQILSARQMIEAQCRVPCRFFAWPYGRSQHFSLALAAIAKREFDATFSAIRSRELSSFDGAVLNRDHFEPGWRTSHVRYFVRLPKRMMRPRAAADASAALLPNDQSDSTAWSIDKLV